MRLMTITLIMMSLVVGWRTYENRLTASREFQRQYAAQTAAFLEAQTINRLLEELIVSSQTQEFLAMNFSSQRFILNKLLRYEPAFTELIVVSRDAWEVVRVSRTELIGPSDFRSRDGYVEVVEGLAGRPYIGPVRISETGEPFVTMSVPVGIAGQETVGVLIAEVNLRSLWDTISNVNVPEHGRAFVVDTYGRLIAHPDLSMVLRGEYWGAYPPVADYIQHQQLTPAYEYTSAAGDLVLGTLAPIPKLGWGVAIEQPLDALRWNAIYIGLITLSVSFVALLLVVIISYITARRAVAPIAELTRGVELLGAGQLGYRLDIRTGDELQTLAEAFNTMSANLFRSRVELSTLAEVDRELTASLDLNRVLQLVLDRAMSATDAHCGLIAITTPDRQSLQILATQGFQGLDEQEVRQPQPLTVGIAGRVARSGEPALVGDVSKDPDYYELGRRTRSQLVIPLIREGQVNGVIDLESRQLYAFTADHLSLVQRLAADAAIAIENARLHQETAQRVRELTALHDISLSIATISNLRELYSQLVTQIANHLGVTKCAILLYEAGREELVCQLPVYGVRDEDIANYRIPLSPESPVRLLWEQGDYYIINDTTTDPMVEATGLRGFAEQMQVRSTLFAVMRSGGRSIGVIQPSDKRDGSPFTEDDARFLSILAAQAGPIVENARLYQQTDAQLTRQVETSNALQRITQELSRTLELDKVLNLLLDEAIRSTGATHGNVSLYDSERGLIWAAATQGYPPHLDAELRQSHPLSANSVTSDVVRSGKAEIVNDSAQESRLVCSRPDTRSGLYIPIARDNKVVGVIGLRHTEPFAFTPEHFSFVQGLANAASVAIHNAQIYSERVEATNRLSQRLEELDALHRISNELAGTLDLDVILPKVLDEAVKATGSEYGTIAFVIEETGELEVRSFAGYSPEEIAQIKTISLPVMRTITRRVYETSEPALLNDVSADPDYYAINPAIQSELAVPVIYEGKPIGVINLESNRLNAYAPEDLRFLEALADQTALAYHDYRRYHEQIRQQTLLRRRAEQQIRLLEISRLVSYGQELAPVLEEVAYGITETAGFNVALISVVEGEPPMIRRVAGAGIPLADLEELKKTTQPLTALQSLLREEFRLGRSYYIPYDRRPDNLDQGLIYTLPGATHQAGGWHVHDLLLVPLTGTDGALLGHISVDDPVDGRRPDRATVEALELFANQASIAIENVRLFQQEQRRIRQAEDLVRLSRVLSASLDLDTTLSAGLVEMTRIMGVEQGGIVLYEPVGGGRTPTHGRIACEIGEDGQPVTPNRRFALARASLSQQMIQDREPIRLPDVKTAPLSPMIARLCQERGIQSMLMVPLLSQGEVVGTLGFDAIQTARRWTNEEVTLAQMMANALAVTLENARLYSTAQQELSERRRAEQALAGERNLLRTLIDNLPDLIYVKDTESRFIAGNIAMARLIGRENPEELLGKTDFDLFPEELAARYRADEEAIIRSGQPLLNREEPVVRPDGQPGWLMTTKVPLRDSNGNIIGLVGIGRDITQRKQAEEALRRQNEYLAALHDTTLGLISRLDVTTLLRDIITRASALLGTSHGYIYLPDPGGEEMEVKVGIGIFSEYIGFRIKKGEGLAGRVWQSGEPLLIEDYDTWPGRAAGIPTGLFHAALAVPMKSGDQVNGVISIAYTEPGRQFGQVESEFLSRFAVLASVALENARLFEQTQVALAETRRLAHRERTIAAITDRIRATTDVKAILQITAEELRRATGSARAVVQLTQEQDKPQV